MIAPAAPRRTQRRSPKNIPDYLIYEIMDGKPIYYKGYKDVLNKTKQPEEIRFTNTLQWVITSYVLRILFAEVGSENNHIATGKPVLHIDAKNNLVGDVLLFRKNDLKPSDFNEKYTTKPAFLHIQIDVSADFVNDLDNNLYLQKKINKLMDFGTQKIIWIFSATKQVLVVTNKEEWRWADWNRSIELIDGQSFNIGEYLDKEGITV